MKKSLPKLVALAIAVGGSILTMSMNDQSAISWNSSQNSAALMETAPTDEVTTEAPKKWIVSSKDCLTTNGNGDTYKYSSYTHCSPGGSAEACAATTCPAP